MLLLKIKLFNMVMSHFPYFARKKLLISCKVLKGNNIVICKNVWFHNYKQVEINDGCSINSDVKFLTEGSSEAKITIGKNVAIAKNVIFETGAHNIGPKNRRAAEATAKDIVVGDGTYIGIGSIILQGVTIGEGCVIQAGSVVFKSCKANCIYGGNPAKLVLDLNKISALS